MSGSAPTPLSGFAFRVFGKVQGVHFRKYTKLEADKLGVVGWVENMADGSVRGEVQGPNARVRDMNVWLRTKGSPASRIQRSIISDERDDLDAPTFESFEIHK